MPNIFLASDHHFDHANILKFDRNDGSGDRLRDFPDVQTMNQHMIDRHNAVVNPEDTVYFLGDVSCGSKPSGLFYLQFMKGRKILIKGNHDWHGLDAYLPYFADIRACHELSGMVLTHIPLHPACVGRWGVNIHGHLHDSNVHHDDGTLDERYFCVCMEQLDDYTPISLEEVKKRVPKTTTLDRSRRK